MNLSWSDLHLFARCCRIGSCSSERLGTCSMTMMRINSSIARKGLILLVYGYQARREPFLRKTQRTRNQAEETIFVRTTQPHYTRAVNESEIPTMQLQRVRLIRCLTFSDSARQTENFLLRLLTPPKRFRKVASSND